MSHRTTARRQAMQEARDIARGHQKSSHSNHGVVPSVSDKRERTDALLKKYKGVQ